MYWDIHCHVDRLTKDEIEEAVDKEVVIGAVAMDMASAEKILILKERYPENIRVFLGIHPEVESSEDEIEKMLSLIEEKHELLAGIGEVGIPYFYMEGKTSEERIELKKRGAKVLERFVEAAVKYQLPLNLHVVEDDIEIALPILERYRIEGALFHWYEGSSEQLEKIIDAGHFISVSPDILRNKQYFDFTKKIPLSSLLLESDSPCPYSGERGVPVMIFQVGKKMAEYHGMKTGKLLKRVEENTLNYLKGINKSQENK